MALVFGRFNRAIGTSFVLLAPLMRSAVVPISTQTAQTDPADWGAILAQVGRQDRAAFTTLYDYFAPRVKGWAMRRGAGAAQAEDVVQDVMLQIWRHAGSFDPAKAAAATWIFTLTRNRYIDIVRKEKHPDLAPDDPMLVTQPETPDAAYDQRQLADRVAAAMLELPTAQRDIITQSFFCRHAAAGNRRAYPIAAWNGKIKSALGVWPLARITWGCAMTIPGNKITHHPTPEMVLAYSNGGLGEAEALIVATHLALCPECRKAASLCDCVGGKMLEDAPEAKVSPSCRDKIFAAIGCDQQKPAALLPISAECFIPEPLRGYLNGAGCHASVRQMVWNPLQPGVAEYKIPLTQGCCQRGAKAKLLQVKAGTEYSFTPDVAPTLLLVLCGALQGDASYQTGDFFAAETLRTGAEDCFILIVTPPPPCPVGRRMAGWLKFLRRSRLK
jgi:RNA polymerase sigma-70 factor (ECF subfamily)